MKDNQFKKRENRIATTRRETITALAASGVLASSTTASASTSDGEINVGGGPMSDELSHLTVQMYDGPADEIPEPGVDGRYFRVTEGNGLWNEGDILEDTGDSWGKIDVGLGSVSAESLGNAVEFALGDSPSAGINEAVARLNGEPGTIIVTKGDHRISEQPQIPSNTTLIIPQGCTISPVDNWSPPPTTIGDPNKDPRDVAAIITNADHENGNENVYISGQGRIHADVDGLDDSMTWAGAHLHNCTRSEIGNGENGYLEIDHVFYDISQEGGITGEQRYFAALVTDSVQSHINGVHGHHTGDDTLGIRTGCEGCEIKNSDAHNPKYGHPAQAANGSIMARGDMNDIQIKHNRLHDTDQKSWSEAGATLHSVDSGAIVDNKIHGTGCGVLLLGGTANIRTDNDISDFVVAGVETRRGVEEITIEDKIRQTGATYAVHILDEQADSEDIDIDVEINGNGNNDAKGVYIHGTNGNELSDITIDAKVSSVGEPAVDILTNNGSTVKMVTVDTINAVDCQIGVRVINLDGALSDVVVTGGTIESLSDGFQGNAPQGVVFDGVEDCICSSVRAEVTGEAFLEQNGADYNTFVGNNGRGSGTAAVQTVAANTKTAANQP